MICSNFTLTKCLLNDTTIKEQNIANKSKKEVCIIKNKTNCPTGDMYAQGQILILFFIFVLPGALFQDKCWAERAQLEEMVLVKQAHTATTLIPCD